jgi:hypothetical protein
VVAGIDLELARGERYGLLAACGGGGFWIALRLSRRRLTS